MNNKPGAPLGNQNARTQGFYSKVLDKTDLRNLKEAETVIGLDDEINLLRAKLKTLVELDADNVRLISSAASSLARLLRTRQFLAKSKGERIRQSVQKTLSRAAFFGR